MSTRKTDPASLGARLGSRSAVRAGRKGRSPGRASPRPSRPSKVHPPKERWSPPKFSGAQVSSLGAAWLNGGLALARGFLVGSTALVHGCLWLSAALLRASFFAVVTMGRTIPRRPPAAVEARIEAFEALPPPIRIQIVGAFFGLLALAVGIRAAQLQLVEGPAYRARVVGQGTAQRAIEGERGRILDRHGEELASSAEAASVYADRSRLPDERRAVARSLGPILEMPSIDLEERLSGRGFTWIRRRLPLSVGDAVRALPISGLGVRSEPRRLY
ncbi:MAG: hypothetical protein AAFU79_01910, partial [Myxococcota bacterium]